MSVIAVDLHKSFAGVPVVKGISLELRPGEIVGFLGPNGAGKTTTVGMLYGIVIPDSGKVEIEGINLFQRPREARAYIGVVPQEDNLDPDINVEENLVRFATYFGLSIAEGRARAEELLALTGLGEHRKKRIDELSRGMRRRLVLARALLNRPKIVFLDEPTTGLDPDVRQEFWKLVLKLREQGTAVLLTTHYMEEAERLCSRVLLLQAGALLDEGSPGELVSRYVGKDLCEVIGLGERQIAELKERFDLWVRPYSVGHLVPLPEAGREEILMFLRSLSPESLTIRSGDLEDVFLGLTGSMLS
jgi:lipooligosaccharide transport system ATP-binding protein